MSAPAQAVFADSGDTCRSEWFPDLLRYMAQVRLNPDDKSETLKTADWLALREQLRGVLRASASADTPYLRTLRKYVRE